MDSQTTIDNLKNQVKEFCEKRNWDQFHNAKDLAIGLVNEASELLQHFRFKSPEQVDALFNDEKRKNELNEELVDSLYFILLLAQRYNIDLSTELDKKMKKNSEKYPVEKVKGINKKYSEY